MTLLEAQKLFAKRIAYLIEALCERGYEVTLGEAYRPPEMAEIYAKEHKGILNSLHCSRLAMDLNIFKDGRLLQTVDELEDVGELWEKSLEGSWGGRFMPPDADHFSFEWEGRR